MTQENKEPSDWGEEVAKQKKLLEDFVRKMNSENPPKTRRLVDEYMVTFDFGFPPKYDEHGKPQSGYFFDNVTYERANPESLYWSPFNDAIDRYKMKQIEQETVEANRRMAKMLEPVKAFDTVAEADEFIADVERYLGYGG